MPMAVPISPVGPVAAATMVFRENGLLQVAAIVKATFAFALHAPMPFAPPEPIFTKEAHRMNNPTRSIVATSDLVPRLPAADVLLVGQAHAPGGGATHMVVRLVVGRGDVTLLDKSVHVVGDRKGSEIKPFRTMPLAYEKAYGGPGYRDNPLGTGVLSGDTPPNLLDPHAPDRVIGFGPISRSWPLRSSLVPAEVRAGLDRPIAEIPPGFDYRFFHAAPPDQRVSHLLGDEWIVIEGAHPDIPQLHLQLPGPQAQTRVVGGDGDGRVFSLRADTLRIDTDAERCTVVWRNNFPVREADLGNVRLLAGVMLPDAPIAWPAHAAPGVPAHHAAAVPVVRSKEGTIVIADDRPLGGTTMEVADEDIESVQVDAPKPDFNTTTVLGPEPATSRLPVFMEARPHPAPQPAPQPPPQTTRLPGAGSPLRAPVDRKEGTLDLSNDFALVGRAVMPFAGNPSPAPAPEPPRAAGPIPGSPWDPGRVAGVPLEEDSTYDTGSTDLAGTLASPTSSPAPLPAPPPSSPPRVVLATPTAPARVDIQSKVDPPSIFESSSPDSAPTNIRELAPPARPQTASHAEPPAQAPPAPPAQAPPAQAPPAPPAQAPPAPPVDPWGQSLREAQEIPAAPPPAPRPAPQGPSVRNALYKRFKKD